MLDHVFPPGSHPWYTLMFENGVRQLVEFLMNKQNYENFKTHTKSLPNTVIKHSNSNCSICVSEQCTLCEYSRAAWFELMDYNLTP